jgi:hypothetical protein
VSIMSIMSVNRTKRDATDKRYHFILVILLVILSNPLVILLRTLRGVLIHSRVDKSYSPRGARGEPEHKNHWSLNNKRRGSRRA